MKKHRRATHTAGALATFVGVVLILPNIVRLLPSSIGDTIGKFLPFNIGHTLISVQPQANQLPPFQLP